MPDAQVAVLIDFENVGLDSIQLLLDQISDVGRVIVKRAYADWSVARSKRDQLLELGFEAVHHFRSAGTAKNSSDICLAIDAIDLQYRSPVDTYVVVSSDSDFVPLVSRLRSAGKVVIGAGKRAMVSRTLVTSCDRYIFLDDLDRPAPTAIPRRQTLPPQVESLVTRGVLASMDDEGTVIAAKLHNTMLRIDPSFAFKALGFKTFTQFLQASQSVKTSRRDGQDDVIVELAPGYEAAIPAISAPIDNGHATNGSGNGAAVAEHDETWDRDIDALWSGRAKLPGDTLPGSWAAGEAARVLGARNLGSTKYKTLQRLLDASDVLKTRWSREGSQIKRRAPAAAAL